MKKKKKKKTKQTNSEEVEPLKLKMYVPLHRMGFPLVCLDIFSSIAQSTEYYYYYFFFSELFETEALFLYECEAERVTKRFFNILIFNYCLDNILY